MVPYALQTQAAVHPLGDVTQLRLAAAGHFGRRPAVVADFCQGLKDLGPVLVALTNWYVEPAPLVHLRLGLGHAVRLEVELQHPLAEAADPLGRRDAVLDHVAAI